MKKNDANDLPPIFSSWKKAYIFVLSFLVFLIFSFYLFTKVFE